MLFCDFNAEQSSCTADVAESVIAREIELLGQRFEVDPRQAGHGVEELFELRRLGIQLFEDSFFAVLCFVLRLPGTERFRQVMPELEQPRIQHLGDSADVARALAVKVESGRWRVEIFRPGSVALAFEELHHHKRVEKIRDAARMQCEFLADFCAREPALSKRSEQTKLNSGKQNFGVPKAESGLEDCIWCWRGRVHEARCTIGRIGWQMTPRDRRKHRTRLRQACGVAGRPRSTSDIQHQKSGLSAL